MKNLFQLENSSSMIERINRLTPETKGIWGKMDVAKMLAHCNVTYDQVFTDKYKKASGLKKFMLKLLVKPIVVGEKPYKKDSRTAPEFIISSDKDFYLEKAKLIEYISNVQQLGADSFNDKESNSFGKLTSNEWNSLFYKHLDHHMRQFGA